MKALNYLDLTVFRANETFVGTSPTRVEAIVEGSSLFDCLERAIDDLRDIGWRVDDLEEFKLHVGLSDLPSGVLRALYYEAKATGAAYVEPREIDSPAVYLDSGYMARADFAT